MPNYEKRGSSWSVRFTVLENGKEKRKRLSAPTKRECREAYEEYIKSYQYHPADLSVITVHTISSLFEAYMEHQKSRIKESSYYDIRNKFENRILPYLGDAVVDKLQASEIDKWVNSLSDYSYKYRKTLYGHLKSLLNYGRKYYDLPNILEKLDPPRNNEGKKEMLYWTHEEYTRFIECVDDPKFALYFAFLYYSGCRRGEAEALTEDDFLPTGKVRINKSITRKVKGKAWSVTTTKNESSVREIVIPTDLYRQITDTFDGRKFVFGDDVPISENTIVRRLRAACQASGVKVIRIHDFRHSCASFLLSNGVPILAVSKHLGHANVTQTLDTYAHLMPSDEQRLMSVMESAFGAKLGQNK